MRKIIILILLVLCLGSSALWAEDQEQTIVLEYYPQWYSHKDFATQGKIGIEEDLQGNDWVKYYTKPSFAYSVDDRWSLHGGAGLYYTDYHIENNNFEARPFLGIGHFTSLTEKWSLSSYLRAEERFQYDTDTRDREDTLRLRLRFRTAYEMNPLSREHSWHKLMLGIEGFRSHIKGQIDSEIQDNYEYETRITTSIERSLSNKDKVRFELAWKFQSLLRDVSEASVSTVYFKIQYFPIWGGLFDNRLSHRGIDE